MTRRFGIIGNPIKHSLSPTLHNYWFKKYKIDAEYTLLDVTENNLSKIIELIEQGLYIDWLWLCLRAWWRFC